MYRWDVPMKLKTNRTVRALAFGIVVLAIHSESLAEPWVTYIDAQSTSVCEVVNSSNLELVVLADTAELVSITGTDLAFIDTLVDAEGTVFYLGQPAGYIEFATDGEGFRTLWLFSLADDVAQLDFLTGELLSTGLLPIDFANVPCAACPLWDEPDECTDTDGDGVVDADDECFNTPFNEIAGSDGCSCSQLDGDDDGVDGCDDLCPSTPFSEFADDFGCSCSQLDDDVDGVDNCVDLCLGTVPGDLTDRDGCSCVQLDDDRDGVTNCSDLCTETPSGGRVGFDGCLVTSGPGGGITVSFCGAANAMIFPLMFCGLVGFRRSARIRSRAGLPTGA